MLDERPYIWQQPTDSMPRESPLACLAAMATLCELEQDAHWHSRAPKKIMQHWRKKNEKRNGEGALQNKQ